MLSALLRALPTLSRRRRAVASTGHDAMSYSIAVCDPTVRDGRDEPVTRRERGAARYAVRPLPRSSTRVPFDGQKAPHRRGQAACSGIEQNVTPTEPAIPVRYENQRPASR